MTSAKIQTCQMPSTDDSILVPHRRLVRLALSVLLACVLVALTRDARAQPARIDYEIGASIGRERGEVRFDERVTFDSSLMTRDAAGSRRVTLWLYADRAHELPRSYDEITVERIFPAGVSRGGFSDLEVSVEGCSAEIVRQADRADPMRGRDIAITVCASAREPVSLRVRGTLVTPRRYGTLGHAEGALMLGDPWYPLVVVGSATPAEGTHRLRVIWDDGTLVSAAGAHAGTFAEVTQRRVTHAPLFVLPSAATLHEAMQGVDVTLATRRPGRVGDAPQTPEGFASSDPWDTDTTSHTARAVRRSVAFLRRLGFTATDEPAARAMATSLVVVEIPERQRLAVNLPGIVAISDHAFRVLPIDRVLRFHADGIARRVFASLLLPHVRSATNATLAPSVAADLDGALLVDLARLADSGRRESPKDLLGFAGFHPSVDQLLYAPKIAFRAEYFHDIEEDDPDRDGVERARTTMPFGRFVLEKLRDRLGADAFARAARDHVERGIAWRAAAERAHGASLDSFFLTWSAHRTLAYGIVARREERSGARTRHVVVIERRGDTWVREPVEVELVDEAGMRVRRTWDAPGARGEVMWESDAPLDDATLDPERRLQEDLSLEPNHPRFDDEIDHSWRPPIFNSFALSVAVTEARPDANLDFVVKRLYDVRAAYGINVSTSARGVSGRVRYLRGIGDLRDANSTFGAWSVSLSTLRSANGFGGSRVPVTEVDVGAGISWDTRRQTVDPKGGFGVSAAVAAGIARQDDAPPGSTFDAGIVKRGGDVQPTLAMSVRGEKLWWPHPLHVVALVGGGGVTRCPALPTQLQGLSGRQLLRGYAADELLGCSDAYAIVEERFTVLRGEYVSIAQLSWFKALELVPFVAGGFLSSRTTASDLLEHPYAEVGGGLRAFFEWAGVQPSLLSIDVGVPLSRATRQYIDADGAVRRRAPVGLYVSFEQTL